MRLVKPSYKIESQIDGESILQAIELAGRTCYKSEDKISLHSSKKFVELVLARGHESVIEHTSLSIRFIVDRGVTHELVRHRLVAYSQESTRYCNYGGGVTFVIPSWVDIEPGEYDYDPTAKIDYTRWKQRLEGDGELANYTTSGNWFEHMLSSEIVYAQLLKQGWSPQQARSVLPNSLKTEIVATTNIREWRHILRLRTSKVAHPQMLEIMLPLLSELKDRIPILFDDIDISK